MNLTNRYLPLRTITPVLNRLAASDLFTLEELGLSVENRPVQALRFGRGSFKVLCWSQMHGNESTTTKALLNYFLALESDPKTKELFESLTILAIPMLNPDGSERFTRENANEVDLNRDAQALTQPESKILSDAFTAFKPNLCLNLHGQRSIYGLTGTENPAVLSFLAPAADTDRTITSARLKAMALINRITNKLHEELGKQIGRYDDSFNLNCVGDTFTATGVPTILFEAGQYQLDYQRNNTAALIQCAYKILFDSLLVHDELPPADEVLSAYLELPENTVNYCDIVVKGGLPGSSAHNKDLQFQYKEVVEKDRLRFIPQLLPKEETPRLYAHRYADGGELSSLLKRLNKDHWSSFIDDYVQKKYSL